MADDETEDRISVTLDEKRCTRRNKSTLKKNEKTSEPTDEYDQIISADYTVRVSDEMAGDDEKVGDSNQHLHWNRLTFKQYMEQDKFFSEVYQDESNGNRRNHRESMYSDALLKKAIRQLNDLGFTGTDGAIPSLIYEIVMLGYLRIYERSLDTFASVRDLIRKGDNDPNFEGAPEMIKELNITQRGGSIKEIKITFYNSTQGDIKEIAELIGITKSSFLVACFWEGATTCDDLPADQIYYGKGIVTQFERVIKMKLGILELLQRIYREEYNSIEPESDKIDNNDNSDETGS